MCDSWRHEGEETHSCTRVFVAIVGSCRLGHGDYPGDGCVAGAHEGGAGPVFGVRNVGLVRDHVLMLESDDGLVDMPFGAGGVWAGQGDSPGLVGFAALFCPLGAEGEVEGEEGCEES